MNANLSHAGTSPRLRLFSAAEASAAGTEDASALLVAISHMEEGESPANLLSGALGDTISLAVDNRVEECGARLGGFCEVIGHALARACDETGPRFNYSLGRPNTVNIADSEGGEL